MTQGTEGYERNAPQFIEACQTLDFELICKDLLELLPPPKSSVLDVGAGAGQNAAALDKLGFDVTAIEPWDEFRVAAQRTSAGTSIKWLPFSLPELICLESGANKFDFVLIEGVWHHLDEIERAQSAAQISRSVYQGGTCAISLRNGPAGLGTRVFPTGTDATVRLFKRQGFECIFRLDNIDSILPNKEDVKWSRVVFQKQ